MSMEQLIEESKRGNQEAFHSLYSQLSDKVFLFIRARAQSRDDALDILQETFLDFWQNLSRFTFMSEGALYAFLYRIVSRKLSRLYLFNFKSIPIDLCDDIGTDETGSEEKSEALHAFGHLSDLTKKDREVMELRYIAGLPFPEIAKLLEVGESAVKVRHHRAMEKLKRILHHE